MNHGRHYVSVCRTFAFVFHCTLPDRCTAEANAQMHDHCQSTCRLFYPTIFQYFFHWMRPSNVFCWRSSCLDLVTAQAIIPQLTSDSVSNTNQMPRVVWSAKCSCHNISCSVYNVLSPSGRSFCLQAHTTHVTPAEPSAMLSTRWVDYTHWFRVACV